MARERTTRSSAYDTEADRCHLLVGKRKRCRQDGVSVEVFNITFTGGPALNRRLLDIVVCIWRGAAGGGGGKLNDAIIMVFHKKKDREECDKYKGIPLVAQSGKILLKAIAPGLSEFCERVGILPGEPNRSTSNMTFVISQLQGLAEKT